MNFRHLLVLYSLFPSTTLFRSLALFDVELGDPPHDDGLYVDGATRPDPPARGHGGHQVLPTDLLDPDFDPGPSPGHHVRGRHGEDDHGHRGADDHFGPALHESPPFSCRSRMPTAASSAAILSWNP